MLDRLMLPPLPTLRGERVILQSEYASQAKAARGAVRSAQQARGEP